MGRLFAVAAMGLLALTVAACGANPQINVPATTAVTATSSTTSTTVPPAATTPGPGSNINPGGTMRTAVLPTTSTTRPVPVGPIRSDMPLATPAPGSSTSTTAATVRVPNAVATSATTTAKSGGN